MQGVMTISQCHRVLLSSMVGRVGCAIEGKMYIVPITYVFEKGAIYALSREGLKLMAMRQHPQVCFQVDQVESLNSWRSVMVWGKFEELNTDLQQKHALQIIASRFDVFQLSEAVKSPVSHPVSVKETKPVVYRIMVDELSGRYEKPSA